MTTITAAMAAPAIFRTFISTFEIVNASPPSRAMQGAVPLSHFQPRNRNPL